MMLSMTTDYVTGVGCPEPYLRRIAEAGFSHVHWCHQWCTDFLYSTPEIEQIWRWLGELNLRLLDLHASSGVEKCWYASREYERLAGVELVRNRIDMTARLSADVIIIHASEPREEEQKDLFWTQLRRSLDALEPFARERGVRIAVENGDFRTIARLLSEYGPDYLGLCYDSGHGNMAGANGLQHVDPLKDRLISVHLHDNDGRGDQHKIPFSGTTDWPRLTRIVAQSAYEKCLSLEVSVRHSEVKDEAVFLQKVFEAGTELARMIEENRRAKGRQVTG